MPRSTLNIGLGYEVAKAVREILRAGTKSNGQKEASNLLGVLLKRVNN